MKHSEIVLVDEVSIHYGNYWLRLRWPGKRGGVAGYVALGPVSANRDEALRGGKLGKREGTSEDEFESLRLGDGLRDGTMMMIERNRDDGDGIGLNKSNSLDIGRL